MVEKTHLDNFSLTSLELASHDKNLVVFADRHGSDLQGGKRKKNEKKGYIRISSVHCFPQDLNPFSLLPIPPTSITPFPPRTTRLPILQPLVFFSFDNLSFFFKKISKNTHRVLAPQILGQRRAHNLPLDSRWSREVSLARLAPVMCDNCVFFIIKKKGKGKRSWLADVVSFKGGD
jgi:hypothetical protein